jgi:hypothetical protein
MTRQTKRGTGKASATTRSATPGRRPRAPRLSIPRPRIADFCRRWKITELALFGSALTGRFNARSDIDVLATYDPDAQWTLFDHVRMQSELSEIFGRRVDLVSREGLETSRNPIRRRSILEGAKVVFAA